MSESLTYLDCWIRVATVLFAQALAGEPVLEESLPKPLAIGAEGHVAVIAGDQSGRFSVVLDPQLFETPLLGEGMDQRAGWAELLHEIAEAATGEMLAKGGLRLHLESFEKAGAESKISRAFQLKTGDQSWTVLVRDEVRAPKATAVPMSTPVAEPSDPSNSFVSSASEPAVGERSDAAESRRRSYDGAASSAPPSMNPGLDLLLDVELEASLRFGSREMPLGEILDLGPGDVVQLDRHIADPVDLIIGDKIVARGEVVLVNGNFGLRVTEVAEPRRRLESIRCLF